MHKLGLKELALGAALALQSNPSAAEKSKIDEGTVRVQCTVVAEAARKATWEALASLEVRTGGMSFAPAYAAEKTEAECLAKDGLKPLKPKPQRTKK